MNVVFIPEAQAYLRNLVTILYEKEYFGFQESARKYVIELHNDIIANLPICLKKPAPPYFDRYGKGVYYAVFKKSKNTQWYVFFRLYEQNGEYVYQIRYIANNHVIAQYL